MISPLQWWRQRRRGDCFSIHSPGGTVIVIACETLMGWRLTNLHHYTFLGTMDLDGTMVDFDDAIDEALVLARSRRDEASAQELIRLRSMIEEA